MLFQIVHIAIEAGWAMLALSDTILWIVRLIELAKLAPTSRQRKLKTPAAGTTGVWRCITEP